MADDHVVLREDALDELYAWLDKVPLSRSKKNIARDFSDGVLCAEVISYFMPKSVEMHNYSCAMSANQKKVNWNTLNSKVLSKLGMKLTDTTIQELIDAKPGAIEKVLWNIRTLVQDRVGQLVEPESSQRRATKYDFTRSRSSSADPTNYSRPSTGSSLFDVEIDPLLQIRGSASHTFAQQAQRACNSSHRGKIQGYIASPSFRSLPDESSIVPISIDYSSASPGFHPMQITYRGQKMIPLTLLEEKIGEIKGLEQANKSVQSKIHKFENLVNVKDQRIEDLTHQLHNLRKMYERTTSATWQSG